MRLNDEAPELSGVFVLRSECRELDPVYTHPKGVYYRYTTLRLGLFRFCGGFHAFGAYLYPATRRQPHPLKIRFLVPFNGGIIFPAEFH